MMLASILAAVLCQADAPSPPEVIERALCLAGVTKDDVVYDLGCGDGRVVVMAAKIYGCKAYGIEKDLEKVKLAREVMKANGLDPSRIAEADVVQFTSTLFTSDGLVIYCYLPQDVLRKLVPVFSRLREARIVSYCHAIPGLSLVKKEGGLYLYKTNGVPHTPSPPAFHSSLSPGLRDCRRHLSSNYG